MARSKIEWLARPGTIPESWNVVTGCTKVSAGCRNCYAERMAKRLAGRFGYPADDPFRVTGHPDRLAQPFRWRKPHTVFVCSMGDLFHEDIAWVDIDTVFERLVDHRNKHHTFILLTKRAERMREFVTENYPGLAKCSPNVWLGVTAETQEQADKRIPALLQIPAAIRFVSVEPMLEEIDMFDVLANNSLYKASRHAGRGHYHGERHEDGSTVAVCDDGTTFYDGVDISWIICGAETGPGARPFDLDWARDLRDQCKRVGVPFFFKRPSPGQETPPDLQIREWPEV